jgi:hypothetical protein
MEVNLRREWTTATNEWGSLFNRMEQEEWSLSWKQRQELEQQ